MRTETLTEIVRIFNRRLSLLRTKEAGQIAQSFLLVDTLPPFHSTALLSFHIVCEMDRAVTHVSEELPEKALKWPLNTWKHAGGGSKLWTAGPSLGDHYFMST